MLVYGEAREGTEPGADNTESKAPVEEPIAEEKETSQAEEMEEKKDGSGKDAEAEEPPLIEAVEPPPPPMQFEGIARAYLVPISEGIGKTNEYILRRAAKAAITNEVKILILDIDTPGGRLDVTLEMMEMLDKFDGETLAYVNTEAISAGAYIAIATNAIYFAPGGVIGAAEVVTGGGQDVPEAMKRKIESYMRAKIRTVAEDHPFRAKVMRAMMDADYVLEIEGKVIKEEGELLSLTAEEAMETFGDPPTPLFGAGIEAEVEDILRNRYGEGNYELTRFEITWSEQLSQYMESIAPILLGVGMLMLFLEFQTPGFGFFGITGLILLAIFFISNHIAGLAGYEPMLFFVLGVLLVLVEVFVVPGTLLPMALGLALVVGSLVWSLADIWPVPDGDGIQFEWDNVLSALRQVMIGIIIAVVGLFAAFRFLPGNALLKRLVVMDTSAPANAVNAGGGNSNHGQKSLPPQGARGVVVSPLHPVGKVEIEGAQFEATVGVGVLPKGEKIVVTGYRNFALLVDKDNEA